MRRIDVITLVGILCVLALILVVSLNWLMQSTADGGRGSNGSQLRGIHQGMVVYAQSNKGHYPGIDSTGVLMDSTLSGQLAILMDTNWVTPDYVINPRDRHLTEAIDYGSGYVVSIFNHSYAGLDLTIAGGRVNAWSETMSSSEVVLGDRNTGSDANENVKSVWTSTVGDWRGMIVRNDNSLDHEKTHRVDTEYAEPLSAVSVTRHAFPEDNIFEAVGPHDAWLVQDCLVAATRCVAGKRGGGLRAGVPAAIAF
ncbi:MAG: hypothetical protein AAF797_15030 [Planctomycetota bacterium]